MRFALVLIMSMLFCDSAFSQCQNGRCAVPVKFDGIAERFGDWKRYEGQESWAHDGTPRGYYHPRLRKWSSWDDIAGQSDWGEVPEHAKDAIGKLLDSGKVAAAPCICGDECKCKKGQCPGKCPLAFPTGVDSDKLQGDEYRVNGEKCSKATAASKIANNIPDLANKWRLVVVGNDAFRRAALDKIGTRETSAVNAYPPENWYVKATGMKGETVYVCKPDGEIVHEVNSTDTALDKALLVTQTTPDKYKEPTLPGPAPAPAPDSSPIPLPNKDNGVGAIIGFLIAVFLKYGLPLIKRKLLPDSQAAIDEAVKKALLQAKQLDAIKQTTDSTKGAW